MNVIIIDDEPLARSLVKEYLQQHADMNILAECGDGFEGLKAIQQHKPDLIFLDIQMPKISGFEMLELVEQPPAVIFTTAFDEYAIKAFETHAADYLLKPFSKERFDKAIHKLVDNKTSKTNSTAELLQEAAHNAAQGNRIVVKNGTKIKIIPFNEILFLEAADDYVKIHTADGAFLKNKTMSFFESLLDDLFFVRSHRSYILNVQEVTRIDPYEKDGHLAILKNGAKIPVSRNGFSKLKKMLDI